MAYSRVVFLTLILSVVSSFAVQVPVFLWGDLTKHSIKSNPLLKVPAEEFSSILKKELVNDPFTVIFIEETLSVEDFSRKNAEGSTTFPYLHANIGNAEYLPSVENPLRVLNKLADPEKVDHVKLTENGLSADIEPESGNFLFINLKDAREGESRADLLCRHNDFMEDMYAKLQERYNSVVAIYTAHYPSWTIPESHSRVRRQTETQSSNYVDMDNLLLYVSSIEYGDGSSIQTFTGFDKGTSVFNTTSFPQTLNSTVTIKESNMSLTLNFQKWGGYWFFQTVTLNNEEVLPATLEVNALDGFSYRCGDRITFAAVHNDTATHNITFVDMKIQPFFETTNDTKEFGDSFNCVGFFSVPIWSGLFVVFILLSITFYGIMMMMDIRTMDRFDDPKGKTITINSAE